MSMGVWGEDEAPSEVTLKDLASLMTKLKEMRDAKDAVKKQASEMEAEIGKLEQKLIEYLKDSGMTSHKANGVHIILTKRVSVAQPATPEDKQALFDYLREKGEFDGMVSVNAQTLTSWARREIEAKKEAGVFGWLPPGLKEPNEYDTLSLRKA